MKRRRRPPVVLPSAFKAAIVHRGGHIRDPGNTNTIGFDACVRRCFSLSTAVAVNWDRVAWARQRDDRTIALVADHRSAENSRTVLVQAIELVTRRLPVAVDARRFMVVHRHVIPWRFRHGIPSPGVRCF